MTYCNIDLIIVNAVKVHNTYIICAPNLGVSTVVFVLESEQQGRFM